MATKTQPSVAAFLVPLHGRLVGNWSVLSAAAAGRSLSAIRWAARASRRGGSEMPDRPTSDPTQFIQGAPVLHVADVKATAAYYRAILGLKGAFGEGEYSVVCRADSEMLLASGGE